MAKFNAISNSKYLSNKDNQFKVHTEEMTRMCALYVGKNKRHATKTFEFRIVLNKNNKKVFLLCFILVVIEAWIETKNVAISALNEITIEM